MAASNGASSPIALTLSTGGTLYCQFIQQVATARADSLAPNNVTSSSLQFIWDSDKGVANASNGNSLDTYVLLSGQSFSIPGITNCNQVWCRAQGTTNNGQTIYGIYLRGLA